VGRASRGCQVCVRRLAAPSDGVPDRDDRRREVERAAWTADGSVELVLDVVRMAEGRLENRPLELAVASYDLEELLRTAAAVLAITAAGFATGGRHGPSRVA
jgi:hypothetical protein